MAETQCQALYGDEAPPDVSMFGGRSMWTIVKQICAVVKLHPGPNILILMFGLSYYMFMVYPMEEMYYYYLDILGKDNATMLVDAWAVIYGTIGAAAAIFLG